MNLDDPALLPAAADETCIPCHVRLHPGHHLRSRKRLRHIIIGAETKSSDLIDIILPCRNDDDRYILHLPDLLTYLEAVLSRQHQIQDDECIVALQCLLKTGITIGCDIDGKAGNLQIIPLQLRNRLLILYNQYVLLILIHSLRLLRALDVFT